MLSIDIPFLIFLLYLFGFDEAVKAELRYEKAEVSTEGNLTDEEKGQLRFKDGVEAYKKNMFALLNKPGYEEESKAIQSRL